MSSDAFADLAGSLGNFGGAPRSLLDANKRPVADSPADKEADGEPHAGKWGPTFQGRARDRAADIMVVRLRVHCHGPRAVSALQPLARSSPRWRIDMGADQVKQPQLMTT